MGQYSPVVSRYQILRWESSNIVLNWEPQMGHSPSPYPTLEDGGNYYELTMPYRAGFGSAILSVLMFAFIATIVWGGLAFLLRVMLDEDAPVLSLPPEDAE